MDKETIVIIKYVCLAIGAFFIINGLTYLAGYLIFTIIYVLIGALFIFAFLVLKKQTENSKPSVTTQPNQNNNTSASKASSANISNIPSPLNATAKPESERDYNLFPIYDPSDETYLAYSYEQSLAFANTSVLTGNGGKAIIFRQEPDNEADKEAVAIYFDNTKVGYLFRGKIKDMANDWINRGEPVIGYINKIDTEQNRATIKIGFYKNIDSLQVKKFKLTKIIKKDDGYSNSRYINLSLCNNKDIVNFEFSIDTGNCVITTECGEELGELSNQAADFICNNESRIKFLRINDISETSSGGYSAYIEAFYK